MKRNFYLQHSLMAVNDPRMKNLIEEEGLKGIGAYWVIIEKLALLPEPRAQLEYLRPFCGRKISFAYLTKIILKYELFTLEEDGYFSPEELNPVKKREKKTAENDVKTTDSKQKNDENQQKTARNDAENQPENSANSLENTDSAKQTIDLFKENIKDIITSSAKKKKLLLMMMIFRSSATPPTFTATSSSSSVGAPIRAALFPMVPLSRANATLEQGKRHSSAGQMPHPSRANTTAQQGKCHTLRPFKCGIGTREVWRHGHRSVASRTVTSRLFVFDTIYRIISCCPITVQAYCEQGDADSEEQWKQEMKDTNAYMVSKLLQPIIHQIADQGYNE